MLTTIAIWYLNPETRSEGIAALRRLARDVKKNEPDTWGYLVHSGGADSVPPCDDDKIVFVEIYKNEKAFKKHLSKGSDFSKFLKKSGHLFLSAPGSKSPFFEVMNVDRIQGFVRPEAGSSNG